ncbi:dTDP-4-dehydrorhamnose reductase [Mucilaginibacter sp. AK015]|uniref:dTDP-4-dehydrorhamnose reductase n=1 Tax=Mucilaginibacter sp. AK015 TaxID=2723072 RepID=UPI0017CB40DD|nr:dTDP-4-dehydrorhamnose reductase [Mucilaginibacter sp. AK015]
MMNSVIVFGASGQLGQCLKTIAGEQKLDNYIFPDETDSNILDTGAISKLFDTYKPAYCINCAAYTAVDKAESDADTAFAVNKTGVENLARICDNFDVTLLHISTDFVFGGEGQAPLTEQSPTNPISVYGQSKLEGELAIPGALQKYFIIRTGWLYSEFGNNFVKTILRIGREKGEISVINDQTGTPTYAIDLARVLNTIIVSKSEKYGLYHYSNAGQATWFDFAVAIHKLANTQVNVLPIPTAEYPTPAKRPVYAVMDKSKIKRTFNINIPEWEDSLAICIEKLKQQVN